MHIAVHIRKQQADQHRTEAGDRAERQCVGKRGAEGRLAENAREGGEGNFLPLQFHIERAGLRLRGRRGAAVFHKQTAVGILQRGERNVRLPALAVNQLEACPRGVGVSLLRAHARMEKALPVPHGDQPLTVVVRQFHIGGFAAGFIRPRAVFIIQRNFLADKAPGGVQVRLADDDAVAHQHRQRIENEQRKKYDQNKYRDQHHRIGKEFFPVQLRALASAHAGFSPLSSK